MELLHTLHDAFENRRLMQEKVQNDWAEKTNKDPWMGRGLWCMAGRLCRQQFSDAGWPLTIDEDWSRCRRQSTPVVYGV